MLEVGSSERLHLKQQFSTWHVCLWSNRDLGQHAKTPVFVCHLIGNAIDPAPCLAGGVPIWQQLHTALWAAVQSQTLILEQAPLLSRAPAAGPGLPSPGEVDSSKGCSSLVVLNSLLVWPLLGTSLPRETLQQTLTAPRIMGASKPLNHNKVDLRGIPKRSVRGHS